MMQWFCSKGEHKPTKLPTTGKELLIKWFVCCLGKSIRSREGLGRELQTARLKEKKHNLNFSYGISRTTEEGVAPEIQFDKMHPTIPNLQMAVSTQFPKTMISNTFSGQIQNCSSTESQLTIAKVHLVKHIEFFTYFTQFHLSCLTSLLTFDTHASCSKFLWVLYDRKILLANLRLYCSITTCQ